MADNSIYTISKSDLTFEIKSSEKDASDTEISNRIRELFNECGQSKQYFHFFNYFPFEVLNV